MTEDEMKYRISMALKAPVLRQGFEIICKENTELGKHNEELIALINAERGRQEKCDDVHLRKITELEKENAELKTVKIPQLERKIASIRGAHSVDCRKLKARTEQVERLKKENAELKKEVKLNEDLATVAYMQGADKQKKKAERQLLKAKEIILRLYNAGRDVLMCRSEEKAYDNLSKAINDRSIEQFLQEVSE